MSDESVIEELAVGQAEDLWSEADTTPDRIDDALRRLLHDRHAENQALAPARVLNLVVLVDREWKGEIANRLSRVGRYNASRTVLCAIEPGRTTLDAWAAMSYDASGGSSGVMQAATMTSVGMRARAATGYDARPSSRAATAEAQAMPKPRSSSALALFHSNFVAADSRTARSRASFRFFKRSSSGSIPRARANSSMCDSRAK